MTIQRIKYKSKDKANANFEIVTLEDFYARSNKKLIEQDFRLNFWVMLYITKGAGVHSIDYQAYHYKAGDLIVVAKNHVQSFRVNSEARGYIININEPFFIENSEKRDLDMLAFFEAPADQPLLQVDMSDQASSKTLIDLMYKEYQSAQGEIEKKLIKSLFNAFIYSIRTENQETVRNFSTAAYKNYYAYRELVEKHFPTLKSVSDYEALMGISKKTLNSACRDCADISAKRLIINRIILETMRLLAQNELKNYQISDLLGFDEPANLAGFFKRYTGMSMREFRSTITSTNRP